MARSRGILIAGNWKMNHGPKDAEAFFATFRQGWEREDFASARGAIGGGLRLALFAPMLSLERAVRASRDLPIAIGAQNVHWEKSGAFTGEVSGPMCQEIGVKWALVGHSERRQHFGETDETARRRAESLLGQDFRVVLCIGETRAERESGETRAVLERQLVGALPQAGRGAARYLDGRLILAYEPVWAIGTGLNATPAQAQEAHAQIRRLLGERFGREATDATPILYGGSVTPENVDSLLECPDVDGALVGGASVKPDSFLKLVAAGGRAV
jgi:triosephosphate isomerase